MLKMYTCIGVIIRKFDKVKYLVFFQKKVKGKNVHILMLAHVLLNEVYSSELSLAHLCEYVYTHLIICISLFIFVTVSF